MTSSPTPEGAALAELSLDGRVRAVLRSGEGIAPELSPRPFLHPVTTPAGVVVTDAFPEDHRWHLGASVTLQDVEGVNFWGGRTYVRDEGYTWRDDHGVVEVDDIASPSPDALEARFRWTGPDGETRLVEHREHRARALDASSWVLQVGFSLRNATNRLIELGSPATNGRVGAGYGGFFWRLPPTSTPMRVTTGDSDGEEAVHGSVAPHLVCQGTSHDGRRWTVRFSAVDEPSRRDPWFVRVTGYPGVCSALAFADPVKLQPGQELRRRFEVLVADGWVDDGAREELAGGAD